MAVHMYMCYQSLFICTCNTNECLYVDATLMGVYISVAAKLVWCAFDAL